MAWLRGSGARPLRNGLSKDVGVLQTAQATRYVGPVQRKREPAWLALVVVVVALGAALVRGGHRSMVRADVVDWGKPFNIEGVELGMSSARVDALAGRARRADARCRIYWTSPTLTFLEAMAEGVNARQPRSLGGVTLREDSDHGVDSLVGQALCQGGCLVLAFGDSEDRLRALRGAPTRMEAGRWRYERPHSATTDLQVFLRHREVRVLAIVAWTH